MADVDVTVLMANRDALDEQITQIEGQALDELAAAKAAHREAPTEQTWLRKAAAVTAVQRIRAHQRAGRTGTQVGGDAFVSTQEG